MSVVRRAAAVLVLLAGWLLLTAAPASAHVEIVSSTPGDSARLSAAPTQVSVELSENIGIQPGSLHVVDTEGVPADTGPVFQVGDDAQQLAVRLRPDLPDGSYLVEYAFVSADSHPVRGTFAFVVGSGPLITSAGAVAGATGTDPGVNALVTTLRWLSFLGVALLGGLVFTQTCRPGAAEDPRARRLLRVGTGLIAGTAVAAFVLQGPYVTGRGLGAIADPTLLAGTFGVAYGKLLLARVAAAAVLAFLVPRLLTPGLPERLRARRENAGLAAGFVVLLSFSATGHPVTDPVLILSIGSDMIHLGAVAVWVGGLLQLAVLLRRPPPGEDPGTAVARFAKPAMWSVVAIVATGAVLTLRILPSLTALWTSAYGVLVLLKIAGLVALLLVANVTRRALQDRFTGDGTTLTLNLRRLRLRVGAEVVLASVVLALAAILSLTSPV